MCEELDIASHANAVFRQFEEGAVVVLNTVVRTSDVRLQRLLDALRNGTMTDENIRTLNSRAFQNLAPTERQNFETNALHTFVTYKEAEQTKLRHVSRVGTPVYLSKAHIEGKRTHLRDLTYEEVEPLFVGGRVRNPKVKTEFVS